ncbi:MAG TPA: hypothetical protein VE110_02550 [Gemmatimonadaceae bacterium]|nr:hypothetical protein [Gemmatimonadaceae bacterium]
MSSLETQREGNSTAAGSSEFAIARVYVAGLIGVFLLVLLAINLFGDNGRSTTRLGGSRAEVLTLSEYELLSRAERLGGSAYWVGPRSGTDHFELEREANGNLYLRYLTTDSLARERRSGSLTVASYPVAEARQRLERAARSKGDRPSRHDGFVMLGSDSSFDAFIVFDELPELQVEIFSPQRGEAVKLALSGSLTPLHWTPLD